MTEMPQHMRALNRANDHRLGRAALKRQIREGETELTDVILDPPACAMTATLHDALCWQHRWKQQRATRFLGRFSGRFPIAGHLTLAALTMRQRTVLITALREERQSLPTSTRRAA